LLIFSVLPSYSFPLQNDISLLKQLFLSRSPEHAAKQQSYDQDRQPQVAEPTEQYYQYKQQRAEAEQAKPERKLRQVPYKLQCQTHNPKEKHYHKNHRQHRSYLLRFSGQIVSIPGESNNVTGVNVTLKAD
jgi:hypothetical protein